MGLQECEISYTESYSGIEFLAQSCPQPALRGQNRATALICDHLTEAGRSTKVFSEI